MNNTDTNNIPQETINSVLIDILKGAKDAGSEIYGASKVGIVKAVDFAQEQAPLVVQEFLTWKFSEAIISVIINIAVIAFFGYIATKCLGKKWLSESMGMTSLGAIISIIISLLILSQSTVPNIKQMVKVKVAPRVYLIEWTTDQISDKSINRH